MALPPDYVPRFSHAEIKRRILYLSERCVWFLNGLKTRHTTWSVNFDPVVMTNVGVSAMDDIWRWKAYHLRDAEAPKLSDAVKRAAYFTKWIVKLRPIYVNRPMDSASFSASFDKNDSTLLINEMFAFHIARGSLAVRAKVPKIITSPTITADMLYDLHYRNMNEDALMAIYQLIYDTAAGHQLIMP